jgi:integrase/recombinase XerD
MKVRRVSSSEGQGLSRCVSFELLDDSGQPLPEVSGFMHFLSARGCSPNTQAAYAYDLLHFTRFLVRHGLDFGTFGPTESILFLEYLRSVPNARACYELEAIKLIK